MQVQKSFNEEKENQAGVLYLVPTPIGNLDDMTFRAVATLKSVDLILAEDTRNSGKLLKHFNISTPMMAFHEHTRQEQVDNIVDKVLTGQSLALISDAGMPIINDPGHPLVQALLAQDIKVIALPGANAALTALVASGLPADRFTYYGFFPRKAGAQADVLRHIGQEESLAIFYESPHRIKKTVERVGQILPPQQTQMVIARELTKKFEEYLRGNVEEILDYLVDHDLKGEIVLLIQGGSLVETDAIVQDDLDIITLVDQEAEQEGISPTQAIKKVAKRLQMKRQEVYDLYHQG